MKLTTLPSRSKINSKIFIMPNPRSSKALPKMAKKATAVELKEAFTSHLQHMKSQVERLSQIAERLGHKLTGKKCKAMEGLIEEGAEVLEADGPGPVIDAALIAAAQRVEHYEISAYGTARWLAKLLGHEDVVYLLQETLDEESAPDEEALQSLSLEEILPAAVADGEPEVSDQEKPARAPAKNEAAFHGVGDERQGGLDPPDLPGCPASPAAGPSRRAGSRRRRPEGGRRTPSRENGRRRQSSPRARRRPGWSAAGTRPQVPRPQAARTSGARAATRVRLNSGE